MKRPATTLAIAATLALSACGSHTTSRVPHIVGLTLRGAEQQLAGHHLRWRIAPGTQIYSQTLPANQHTSMDDIPVTGQHPTANTPTRPNTVITIITPCTSTHPCS